jgi:phytoene dehydrogenase-like protein
VVHVAGGMGGIADKLVATIRKHGGKVIFRQEISQIKRIANQTYKLITKRGREFHADTLIGNLTPWSFAQLLGDDTPKKINSLPDKPRNGWGAFMVYAGIDENLVSEDAPLHHQVVKQAPFGEGNTVFVSISPAWDKTRAPAGKRAVTLSTHTRLEPWWDLYKHNPGEYQNHKIRYQKEMLTLAERAVPGISNPSFSMTGTPVTFTRFTRRKDGWVGGFPQTNLFRTMAPKLAPNLWMVGDSIFPGQSIAAVTLGGMRVADNILTENYSTRKISTKSEYNPSSFEKTLSSGRKSL